MREAEMATTDDERVSNALDRLTNERYKLSSKLSQIEVAAEQALRHGYELDPADILEIITGEAP
jgi:hypothetical protein